MLVGFLLGSQQGPKCCHGSLMAIEIESATQTAARKVFGVDPGARFEVGEHTVDTRCSHLPHQGTKVVYQGEADDTQVVADPHWFEAQRKSKQANLLDVFHPCEPWGAHRGSTIAVDQSEHTQTELPTAIELNQAIVLARDKVASAKFFARNLAFLSRSAQLDTSRRCALTIPRAGFYR